MQRSEQNVAAKQAINMRYEASVDFFYPACDLKLIFCSNIKIIKNNIIVQF